MQVKKSLKSKDELPILTDYLPIEDSLGNSRNFNSLKNGMYLRVLVHCFGTNHYQLYDGSVDNVYNVASILPSGLFFKTTSNTRSNRHGFLSELGIPRENAANFEQPCLASMDAKNAPGTSFISGFSSKPSPLEVGSAPLVSVSIGLASSSTSSVTSFFCSSSTATCSNQSEVQTSTNNGTTFAQEGRGLVNPQCKNEKD
ncbi:hypothetical protein M9H77_13312 [Catharanthus roseus]|uniref:Uncharacterized protein n=1 Tax=Catharanthus roseus TaxID=4058 RepID=A0ACC0BK07_CATRO|nr:hypothetical protein M9H77_13312 [Catharanthus roseus]